MVYVVVRNGDTGHELVLQGLITGHDSCGLIPLVVNNLKEGITRVVVDLNECDLLTSDLLSNLCQLQKTLENKQIPVVLTRMRGINKQISDRLGIQKKFPVEIGED
jgi:anti-anti-sigma regulatory factor